MSAAPALGIDLGGTKVHAGVVTPGGDVLGQARVPTQAEEDQATVLGNIVAAARQAVDASGVGVADLAGVGLGSPAPLDMFNGILVSPNNLLSLHDCHIVEWLGGELGLPVTLNNDANCFGLAEARFGAGVGVRVCCGLTLGTDMGGFIVLDGQVFNGPHGAGGEPWCSPFEGDQIEEKVSGRAVVRNYRKMTEKVAGARELADMARAGDADALEAWREFGADLAVPIAWMCNLLDPEVFVLGGSMVKAWDLFEETMRHESRKYINEVTRGAVRIVPGKLGDAAGMLGAAALVLEPDDGD